MHWSSASPVLTSAELTRLQAATSAELTRLQAATSAELTRLQAATSAALTTYKQTKGFKHAEDRCIRAHPASFVS